MKKKYGHCWGAVKVWQGKEKKRIRNEANIVVDKCARTEASNRLHNNTTALALILGLQSTFYNLQSTTLHDLHVSDYTGKRTSREAPRSY